MTRAPAALAVGLAACTHAVAPALPTAPPLAGATVSLYASGDGGALAIVDDRRWLEVRGGALDLEELDPAVGLDALVLEPLAGPGPLVVGACTREHVVAGAAPPAASGLGAGPVPPAPTPVARKLVGKDAATEELRRDSALLVGEGPARGSELAPRARCAVTGAPGRYLVRLLYPATSLSYHAEHEVALAAPDRAHIASRLAIVAPAWPARDGAPVTALVIAYEGLPGGETPPLELARGTVVLDGAAHTLGLPARDVPARLRRVLSASEDLTTGDDAPEAWIAQRRASNADEPDALVFAWLELPGTHLAPGPLHVRVDYPGEAAHEVIVTAETRAQTAAGVLGGLLGGPLRLPLWADDELRASIRRTFDGGTERTIREHFSATITNLGDTPREVDVEEKLRPDGHRAVSEAFPGKAALVGNTLRTKLAIGPNGRAQTGFLVDYRY